MGVERSTRPRQPAAASAGPATMGMGAEAPGPKPAVARLKRTAATEPSSPTSTIHSSGPQNSSATSTQSSSESVAITERLMLCWVGINDQIGLATRSKESVGEEKFVGIMFLGVRGAGKYSSEMLSEEGARASRALDADAHARTSSPIMTVHT
ncbi:hypothetical protein U9M48_012091 [Paspalum notatum var. saurae]|uniref:Uncharacterized protein n=1 Tax=Paspalum notatum var. saurae TaxID=547442 RepID=A0AAQ3SX49_PASNO